MKTNNSKLPGYCLQEIREDKEFGFCSLLDVILSRETEYYCWKNSALEALSSRKVFKSTTQLCNFGITNTSFLLNSVSSLIKLAYWLLSNSNNLC